MCAVLEWMVGFPAERTGGCVEAIRVVVANFAADETFGDERVRVNLDLTSSD